MHRIKFIKPTLFGIFILLLCLIPAKSIEKLDFLTISFKDLILHFLMFSAFTILLAMDFKKHKILNNNRLHQFLVLIMIAVLFSALTELLQYAFPVLNRSANAGDFLFDFIGSAAGGVIILFIRK